MASIPKNPPASVADFNRRILGYSRLGNLELALLTFREMANSHFKPNQQTILSLLRPELYPKVEDLLFLFREVFYKSLIPDQNTCLHILLDLSWNRRFKELFQFLDWMENQQMAYPSVAMAQIIKILFDHHEFSRAEMVVKKLKEQGTLDVFHCNCMINGYLTAGKPKEAERHLQAIYEIGKVPNDFTQKIASSHFEKWNARAKLSESERYVAQIDDLLKCNCLHPTKEDVAQAYQLVLQLIRMGKKPNGLLYSRVMNALAANGAFDSAFSLLEKMAKVGVAPIEHAFSHLLPRLISLGRLKESAMCLLVMQKENFSMKETFMKGVQKLKRRQKEKTPAFLLLFHIFESSGIPEDFFDNSPPLELEELKLILRFCGAMRKPESAWALLHKVKTLGFPTDFECYEGVFFACAKSEEASGTFSDVQKDVREEWLPITPYIHLCLMERELQRNQVESAARIFVDENIGPWILDHFQVKLERHLPVDKKALKNAIVLDLRTFPPNFVYFFLEQYFNLNPREKFLEILVREEKSLVEFDWQCTIGELETLLKINLSKFTIYPNNNHFDCYLVKPAGRAP
jgi:pentatricopeptide repeat protein